MMETQLTYHHTMTALALFAATQAAADPAGFAEISFTADHHSGPVTGAVWYPADSGGTPILFADNPVFQGMEVLQDADVAVGPHPVILLSHGFGGGVESVAWLGTALAEAGAVVISVNHPNTTWRDFDVAAGAAHWTRPLDLSAALTAVAALPAFAGDLETDSVTALGFSYGGWTALSLGGARSNLAAFVSHCAEFGPDSSYCGVLAREGVDVAAIDAQAWDASYADPRVTRVIALDPGLVWNVAADDLADLVADVHLIGFGEGADRMLGTDFDAAGFADLVPTAQVTRIVPGIHFTAMPLCKPAGEAILVAEEDDPVCTDPAGTDRAAVHDQIVALVLAEIDN